MFAECASYLRFGMPRTPAPAPAPTPTSAHHRKTAENVRVGLTMPSTRVVISGNGGHGIFAQGRFLSVGLAHIGVNPDGTYMLANFGDGINVADGADDPRVGSKRFGAVDAVDSQTVRPCCLPWGVRVKVLMYTPKGLADGAPLLVALCAESREGGLRLLDYRHCHVP